MKSSAIDVLQQLKFYQLLHNCTKNYILKGDCHYNCHCLTGYISLPISDL